MGTEYTLTLDGSQVASRGGFEVARPPLDGHPGHGANNGNGNGAGNGNGNGAGTGDGSGGVVVTGDGFVGGPAGGGASAGGPVGGGGGGAITRVETQRVSVDDFMDADRGPVPVGAGATELRRLHQMMRGRYALAMALAAAVGTAGGYLGFHAGRTLYASTGQIRVMPVVPKVLYSIEEKGQLPAFDNFVESQVAMIKGQRVIQRAMEDPVWVGLGRSRSDQAMAAYMSAITVVREGDMIQIQAIDPDPSAAVAEVNALVTAYNTLYDAEEGQAGDKRAEKLLSHREVLKSNLDRLRTDIEALAKGYGSDNLQNEHTSKEQQVQRMDTDIDDLQMRLSTAKRAGGGTATGGLPDNPTPEEWATVSRQMDQYVQQRDQIQEQVDELLATSAGSANQAVIDGRKRVQIKADQIARLSAQLRAARAAGQVFVAGPAATPGGPAAVPVAALEAQLADYQARRTKAYDEMLSIGQADLKIRDLQYKSNAVRQEYDNAERELDEMDVERTVSGRIHVISPGDKPLGPYKDTHLPLAAGGGLGGAVLGFGLIAGLAALDRRVRNPGEAESAAAGSVLGLLPRLPEDLSDPVQAATAAHCVNEVRTALQLWGRQGRRRVFAITSPAAGAGKTSLTLALGVSFAAAKLRTLIVDCDLVGCGLTTRADQIVTRRLGQVLLGRGVLTEAQLARALDKCRATGERLGEALVASGVLSAEELAQAIDDQSQQRVGIIDALHGTPLGLCTAEMGIPNLHLLSAGAATARDVPLLSSQAMSDLINELKRAFDVVLIDTGPILGSLEAQLVSAMADGVVMCVTKGVSRPLVGRAMAQLGTLNARVAGIVFNRASLGDVVIYGSQTTSTPMRSVPRDGYVPAPGDAGRASAFGPLAVAVAQCSPLTPGQPGR